MKGFAADQPALHGLECIKTLCAGQGSTLLLRAPGNLQGASYLLGNLGSPGLLAGLAPPLWACTSSKLTA